LSVLDRRAIATAIGQAQLRRIDMGSMNATRSRLLFTHCTFKMTHGVVKVRTFNDQAAIGRRGPDREVRN
jgi:hypothetical protein